MTINTRITKKKKKKKYKSKRYFVLFNRYKCKYYGFTKKRTTVLSSCYIHTRAHHIADTPIK